MPYLSDSDFDERVRARLDPLHFASDWPMRLGGGDFELDEDRTDILPAGTILRPAAVFVPIVRRKEGYSVLLTQRTETMPSHPGQISFPGGSIQENDSGPLAAALRETMEETGIAPEALEAVGAFDPYATGTGFVIAPIVGYVSPDYVARPDPREVAEVFETPLSFLMTRANARRETVEWRGKMRAYYEMPYENRRIWGATAGMLLALQKRLYGGDAP